MTPVSSLNDLIADPVGHSWRGTNVAVWCYDPQLLGVIVWGQPDVTEIAVLAELVDLPTHPALAPDVDLFIDASRLLAISPEVHFLVDARLSASARNVGRGKKALLRPEGVNGAIATGLTHLLTQEDRWGVFSGVGEALDWLGRADGAAIARALVSISEQPLLGRLRAMFQQHGLDIGVAAAGRHLGMSSRSLQRFLERMGTTYREVRERERMLLAKELLAQTDLKGEAISRRLGYASAAQFTTFFRLRAGAPPATWRQQFRQRYALSTQQEDAI